MHVAHDLLGVRRDGASHRDANPGHAGLRPWIAERDSFPSAKADSEPVHAEPTESARAHLTVKPVEGELVELYKVDGYEAVEPDAAASWARNHALVCTAPCATTVPAGTKLFIAGSHYNSGAFLAEPGTTTLNVVPKSGGGGGLVMGGVVAAVGGSLLIPGASVALAIGDDLPKAVPVTGLVVGVVALMAATPLIIAGAHVAQRARATEVYDGGGRLLSPRGRASF
jgi:hypothetical protein